MIRRSTIVLLGGLATGACASTTPPPDAGGMADACLVMPSGPAPASGYLALPHPIQRYRLDAPGNDGAAMLFAAVQETLVETDCRGRPMPALATSWSSDESKRIWSFTLRPDVVFTDGTRLDARGVAAGWTESDEWAGPGTLYPRTRIRNVRVTGAYALTVELAEPVDVTFFTDPSLGVRRFVDSWPVGTGPYEIVRPDRPWTRAELTMKLRLSAATASSRGDLPAELNFMGMDAEPDLRMALDAGADGLASRERAVLDYARTLGGYELTPLPWDATHYLLAPAATADVHVPDSALMSLARDAVGGGAVPAPPLDVDDDISYATAGRPRNPAAGSSPRIVYYDVDPVSRSLAERLVALAARNERAPWIDARLPRGLLRAEGLTVDEFWPVLMAGREAGYVFPIQARSDGTLQKSLLSNLGGAPPSALLTPLVKSRLTLIHRPWLGPLRIDGEGTPRLGLPRTSRQR